MIDTVVYLFPFPVAAQAQEKYGVTELRERGFAVIAADCSALLGHSGVEGLTQSPMEMRAIATYEELDLFVQETAPRAVFIDYLIGLSGIDGRHWRVFKALGRHRGRYLIINGGALPLLARHRRESLVGRLVRRLGKALHGRALVEYAHRALLRLAINYMAFCPLPARILGTESELLEEYLRAYRCDRSIYVKTHSLDFNGWLRSRELPLDIAGLPERFCVFLDDMVVGHPDYEILGLPPLEGERYFASMRRLFDTVERKTHLPVVVAAHPMSQYEKTPGIFGERLVVRDMTALLASRCEFAIAHMSTSVNFAVLSGRPLLFVKTAEMAQRDHYRTVDAIAAALGLEAVNIDDGDALAAVSLEYRQWPTGGYEPYLYRHVKSRGVRDASLWELVAEEIRCIDAQEGPVTPP